MQRAIPSVVVGGAAFAALSGALQAGFITLDDPAYVTEAAVVADGLTWAGLRAAFAGEHAFYWHPLTTISHMLDVELYGLAPRGHHFTSLLLHAVASVALLSALAAARAPRAPSLFVALVFAAHPLRAESVVWIAERKDVLAALFTWTTIAAYAGWARAPTRARAALVAASFVAGAMSKPSVATLPFVLLLLDHWPLRRARAAGGDVPLARLVVEKLPLFAIAAAGTVIVLLQTRAASLSFTVLPAGRRAALAVVGVVDALGRLAWPADLSIWYPIRATSAGPAATVVATTLVVVVTAACVAQRRRRPYLLVGWLFFLGTYFPVSGVLQKGGQWSADRFTYVAHVGVVLAVACLVDEAVRDRRRARAAAALLAAVLVVACVFATRAYTRAWRTSEALYAHGLASTGDDNGHLHKMLAQLAFNRGDADAALRHARRAWDLSPVDPAPPEIVGHVLLRRGDVDGAVDAFVESLSRDRSSSTAHMGLAAALARRGEVDAARRERAIGEALRRGLVEPSAVE